MDEKNREELGQEIDRLENIEVEELSEGDLESIAGGAEEAECSSTWCCTSSQEQVADA